MKAILTKFKFVGKISKMGENRVVWIPKQYHEKIMDLEDKQVRVMIDDEI
jgi:antitoxin component of MazEF toxin-antitoxin module